MAYTAILQRIRLLIPEQLDGHYNAIRRGFEEGDKAWQSRIWC
jgi:hypothetical protein